VPPIFHDDFELGSRFDIGQIIETQEMMATERGD
jgi:hypothetical protein